MDPEEVRDPDSSNEGVYLRTYTLEQPSSEKVIKVEEKVSRVPYSQPYGVITSLSEPKRRYLLTVDQRGYLRSYHLNFDEVTTSAQPLTVREQGQRFKLGGQYYEREAFNWEDCQIRMIEKSTEDGEILGLKLTLEFNDELESQEVIEIRLEVDESGRIIEMEDLLNYGI